MELVQNFLDYYKMPEDIQQVVCIYIYDHHRCPYCKRVPPNHCIICSDGTQTLFLRYQVIEAKRLPGNFYLDHYRPTIGADGWFAIRVKEESLKKIRKKWERYTRLTIPL